MDIAIALGSGSAQTLNAFSPIPGLAVAAGLLTVIIQLCQNVSTNRAAANQLGNRCYKLLLVIRDCGEDMDSSKVKSALSHVEHTFHHVESKMQVWAKLNRLKAFVDQKKISDDIQNCHLEIDNCLTKFNIVAQVEVHNWQSNFKENAALDHQQVIEYLADIQNSQTIIVDVLERQSSMAHDIMQMMQDALVETDPRKKRSLKRNLYRLQVATGELLPDFNLERDEVERVGLFPEYGSGGMDIYEGCYLAEEKVAIKMLRSVVANSHTLERFKREVKIWADLWNIDKGKRILPFYGFCQTDGPYPYMVSPWQKNGNAIDYVKANDHNVNYKDLIRGIAEGIRVLHTMKPNPIVHGDLKGANVMIDRWGNPLLADFGLSKFVEELSGTLFTQSRGVSESYRWFAPEIFDGFLFISSDIFSLAMTILELMTHQHPYNHIKITPQVIKRVTSGELPNCPQDARVVDRGLNEELWNILKKCWNMDRTKRPTIEEVLVQLP